MTFVGDEAPWAQSGAPTGRDPGTRQLPPMPHEERVCAPRRAVPNRRQLLATASAVALEPWLLADVSHAAPADATAAGVEWFALDSFGVLAMNRQRFLVGELAVRNAGPQPLSMQRLTLVPEDRGGPLIAEISGDALQALASLPNGRMAQSLTLAAGEQRNLHFWHALPAAGGEQALAAELVFSRGDGAPQAHAVRAPIGAPELAVALSPPLRGGPWIAVFDPWFALGHRRAAFVRDGQRFIPARFAIDWIRVDARGSPSPADRPGFEHWHGLDSEVLAVADGEIVALRDGREDVLGARREGARWTDDDVAGNYLCLQVGGGRCVFYEHLRQGSIAVKMGERVKAGQVIARLGRSGINSSGPHLHFHVADRPALIAAQGRPYVLSAFRQLGAYASMAQAESGQPWPASAHPQGERFQNEMPAANAVVQFD